MSEHSGEGSDAHAGVRSAGGERVAHVVDHATKAGNLNFRVLGLDGGKGKFFKSGPFGRKNEPTLSGGYQASEDVEGLLPKLQRPSRGLTLTIDDPKAPAIQVDVRDLD